MVRCEGLEPPTYWFVASHSIQLSYRRVPRSTRSSILAHPRQKCKGEFQIFMPKTQIFRPAGKTPCGAARGTV